MKKIFITIIMSLSVLSSGLTFMPIKTYAQSSNADNFELTVAVKNPLGDKKEFKDILNSVLRAIMDIVLPVVIVMVIYSGFLYVMARGNPDAIGKAHKTLTWTLVGAAILLGAQLIATVLIDTVSNISKDAGVSSSSSSRTNNNVAVNNSNNARNVAGVNNPSGNNSNTANVANNGFSNNQNTNTNSTGGTTTGSSSGGSTGNTSSSVQTTKYYVNAPNGARLRSEPNTTSSFKTQPYGTVLNVSGETSGFYNIYNSAGTEKIGYIAKNLLTLGNSAPNQNKSSSLNTLDKVIINSITPNTVFDGFGRYDVRLTVNYQVENNANISLTDKFELLCSSNNFFYSYTYEIVPSDKLLRTPGIHSVNISLNKKYSAGNNECYIRYVDDITKSIKWSNTITTVFK